MVQVPFMALREERKQFMKGKKQKAALSFVLLMGLVSMFSDMTHEGARSIYGAFLGLAGVSTATIGFVMGLGEFIGYSLRLLTGYWADKRKNYWTMTLIGYAINMGAVPLLALCTRDGWLWACFLIVFERLGKAIRQPSKNTLVSFASAQVGAGKAFALQEFMDQIGAFSGPLILFLIMFFKSGSWSEFSTYRLCFAVLFVPACLTVFSLLCAKRKFPHPEVMEMNGDVAGTGKMGGKFFLYMASTSLLAFGFIDFPIITVHVSRLHVMEESFLPLLYAWAMLADAVSALVFGWMYDRRGLSVLVISAVLSLFFAPLVFLPHSLLYIVAGVTLWGIGMGAQESILKSAVATFVPKENRSTGFGLFETSFGVCWFLGSWFLGFLYDWSIECMVVVSVLMQLLSVPLLLLIKRTH